MTKRILVGVFAVSVIALLFSCRSAFAGGPGGPGGPRWAGPDMPSFIDNGPGGVLHSIKAELTSDQFNALIETVNKRLSNGESIEQIIGHPRP